MESRTVAELLATIAPEHAKIAANVVGVASHDEPDVYTFDDGSRLSLIGGSSTVLESAEIHSYQIRYYGVSTGPGILAPDSRVAIALYVRRTPGIACLGALSAVKTSVP